MHRTSDPHLARHLLLLAVAASAPVALGVAMHEEHLAMERPIVAPACEPTTIAVPIAIATPMTEPPAPEPVKATEPEPTPQPIPLTYGEAFAFVVDIDGPHVVLATTIDDRWIGGTSHTIDRESVRRAVDLGALPDDIGARLGASFHAYSAEGLVCSGTLGDPFVHAAASDWEYDLTEEEQARQDRASWVWEQGRRILVAPLDGASACDGALWARAAALAPPTFATAIDRPTKTQVQAARRGFLRTEPMRVASADYDRWITETAAEPDAALGRPPRLRDRLSSTAWDLGSDGVDAVVLDIDGPEFGGCGGLEYAWALAVVEADGAMVDRIVHGESGEALGLVDVDGDGTAEILGGPRDGWGNRSLLRLQDDGLVPVAALEPVPFFGCPC